MMSSRMGRRTAIVALAALVATACGSGDDATAPGRELTPEQQRTERLLEAAKAGKPISADDIPTGRLNKVDYQLVMNDLYVDHVAKVFSSFDVEEGLDGVSRDDLDEALAVTEDYVEVLEAIKPPREVADAHETYVDVYGAVPRIIEILQPAAENGASGLTETLAMGQAALEYRDLPDRLEAAEDQYREHGYDLIPVAIGELRDQAVEAMRDKAIAAARRTLRE